MHYNNENNVYIRIRHLYYVQTEFTAKTRDAPAHNRTIHYLSKLMQSLK